MTVFKTFWKVVKKYKGTIIDTEEKSIDDIVQEIEEKVIKKIKGEELDER